MFYGSGFPGASTMNSRLCGDPARSRQSPAPPPHGAAAASSLATRSPLRQAAQVHALASLHHVKEQNGSFGRHHLVRLPWMAGRAGSASLHCPRNEAFSFFKRHNCVTVLTYKSKGSQITKIN